MDAVNSSSGSAVGPRKGKWAIAAAGLVALGLGAFAVYRYTARPAYRGPVRHVIVISLDTTRADHLGCYGNPWIKTPRLDRLASESILFTDCMTVVPTTLASHVSLFTGKYPHTHGTPRNGFMVNRENVMLAEVLKDAGFHTAGFIGSFALDSRFDFAQGFDHYDETYDRLAGEGGVAQSQRRAQAVTDTVIEYLDEVGVPANLFLFVHYFDPHSPYSPPSPYDRLYSPAGRPPMSEQESSEAFVKWRRDTPGADNEVARALAQLYAGEVSYLDEHVGRLLEDLRRRGILDQAILIITSDHGENFWEHWYYFHHGETLYQTCIDAVCMIRVPGAAHGGTRVGQPVANTDILPTLLNYLALPMPEEVEGQVLDLTHPDKPFAPRARFSEASQPFDEVETDPRWYNLRKSRCVREGNFKYISTPFKGTEELYDLAADPQEQHDLLKAGAPQAVATAAELRRKLDAWTQSANPLASFFEKAQKQETMQRLRSMGYVGGH